MFLNVYLYIASSFIWLCVYGIITHEEPMLRILSCPLPLSAISWLWLAVHQLIIMCDSDIIIGFLTSSEVRLYTYNSHIYVYIPTYVQAIDVWVREFQCNQLTACNNNNNNKFVIVCHCKNPSCSLLIWYLTHSFINASSWWMLCGFLTATVQIVIGNQIGCCLKKS